MDRTPAAGMAMNLTAPGYDEKKYVTDEKGLIQVPFTAYLHIGLGRGAPKSAIVLNHLAAAGDFAEINLVGGDDQVALFILAHLFRLQHQGGQVIDGQNQPLLFLNVVVLRRGAGPPGRGGPH